jgi:hypothetical protein
MWGQLLVEKPVIAINSRGEYFYDLGMCNTLNSVTICDPEILNISLLPDSCMAELVLNKGLGNLCLSSMKIFLPVRQEYIYLKSGDEVVIFSPMNDTLTFKCRIANIPDSKQLEKGLNKLIVPKGCIARSSELVIHSHSMVMDKGMMPSVDKLDFAKDVDDLSGLIESEHNLNFTKVINELSELGEDVRHVSVDLVSVDQSLVEFRKIRALTGYHPLNISLSDPLSLANVTSYSGATATLLMFIFVCYVCYKCATCCKPVFGLFKCIFGSIFGLFKKTFDLCGKFRVAKDDIEMTTDSKDDFLPKVATNSGHIVWETEQIGQRLVLYAEL